MSAAAQLAPTGTAYGRSQLEALWVRAGGDPKAAPMAAAIALAESAGRPNATNRNTNGTIDRGPWQINSVHGSLSTYDELGNARAAVKISRNGRDWTPWVTFTNGAYRKFLTGHTTIAAAAAGATPAPGTSSSADVGAGAYGGLGGFLLKALLWLGFLAAGVAIALYGARGALAPARRPA